MVYRYVPILRSKAGEAVALSHISGARRSKIVPVIQLTEQVPATFSKKAVQGWTGQVMGLDGTYNFARTGSVTDYRNLFKELGSGKINVVPVIDCDAPVQYLSMIQSLVNRYSPGLMVRATLAQLSKVQGWVLAQGWAAADVDLIISVGYVSGFDPAQFSKFVDHTIKSALPVRPAYRTITLVSAAAPRDYSAYSVGRISVPRLDWALWQSVQSGLKFQLDYGDFGVAHPDMTEPPGVAMARATVSVRYTVDSEWVLLKGNSISGPRGRPMAVQYRAHAKALMAEPQFGRLANCWADDRISSIAAGTVGAGSRGSWVEISVNRHLSLVADRLP